MATLTIDMLAQTELTVHATAITEEREHIQKLPWEVILLVADVLDESSLYNLARTSRTSWGLIERMVFRADARRLAVLARNLPDHYSLCGLYGPGKTLPKLAALQSTIANNLPLNTIRKAIAACL